MIRVKVGPQEPAVHEAIRQALKLQRACRWATLPLSDSLGADAEFGGDGDLAAGLLDGEFECFVHETGLKPIFRSDARETFMDVERDVNALDPMPDRTPPSREDGARLLGLALKAAREKRGKSRHDVAALVGATYQAVANWEKGSNGPSRDRLVQICEYLGIDINAALKGDVIYVTDYVTTPSEKPDNKLVSGATLEDNVKIVSGPTMPPPPNRANAPLDVPVYGIAVGGVDADFQFNGTVAEHVRRPPAISGLRDVYAVHVVNESMYPAYREGDLLYVNPNRQPVIGDDVIVELHPTDEAQGAGKAFIKRLKRRTPTKIVCEQFNPPCDLEFDREAIKALHRVIPMRELLGT